MLGFEILDWQTMNNYLSLVLLKFQSAGKFTTLVLEVSMQNCVQPIKKPRFQQIELHLNKSNLKIIEI